MNNSERAARHAGSTRRREQTRLSIILAVIAGFVDAAGYLALFHLFTAHMSGNSAAMGAFAGMGHWREALHRAFPIPLFVAGVAGGAALTEIGLRCNFRAPFALALGVEAALLALFMALGDGFFRSGAAASTSTETGWKFYALAALPAFAMGMQNATLRRVGNLPIRTTYVSGMLTDFAEAGVDYLFQTKPRRTMLQSMMIYAALWCAFAVGAVCGGYGETRWGLRALLVPLCGLALVIAWDFIAPIAPSARSHEKQK